MINRIRPITKDSVVIGWASPLLIKACGIIRTKPLAVLDKNKQWYGFLVDLNTGALRYKTDAPSPTSAGVWQQLSDHVKTSAEEVLEALSPKSLKKTRT